MTAGSTHYPNETRDFDEQRRTKASQIGEMASSMADKTGDRIEGAVNTAERAAQNLSRQGREASERIGEVAGNLKGAVDKSVSDQPMATLAVAAALGFVIGALWKS